MPTEVRRFFCFGPFRLDATDRLLFKGDTAVALTPKALDILVLLVGNHGRVLTKQELIERVWPDTKVEENNLIQNISLLRKVLGDDAESPRFIETLTKRGYRFVASVREGADIGVDRIIPGEPLAPPAPAFVPIPVRGPLRRSRLRARTWTLLVASVAVATAAVAWSRRNDRIAVSPHPRFSRLTTSGRAMLASVSPDGRYLAYVLALPEGQTLRIQQIQTGSETEIVPSSAAEYWAVTISPDNLYLYFLSWLRNKTDATLFRVPLLGGAPQRLIEGVGSPITFAPDGKRFAFVREHDERGNSHLVVASVEDLHGYVLHTLRNSWSMAPHMSGPAWSPAGDLIVVPVGNPLAHHGIRERRLVAVDVHGGSPRPIGSRSWFDVGRLAWNSRGDALIFTARGASSAPKQIWTLGLSSGEARQLTDDLNDYGSVSSIANASEALAAVRTEVIQELWVETPGARPVLVASEVGNHAGMEGFCWTPDGRIIYSARGAGGYDLWAADPASIARQQLTVDAGNNVHPVASPDGQYVLFASDRGGHFGVWRMTLDTRDVKQLTFGREDTRPRISPDGQWVVYQQGNNWGVDISLWKVSIDGGASEQLTESLTMRPAISPDGRWLAYYYMDREGWGIALSPLSGGAALRKFSIPPTARERVVRWTADASSLAYVNEHGAVSELWLQPRGGGTPYHLRSFPMGPVATFEWSASGTRLAWVRANETSDVMRIDLR